MKMKFQNVSKLSIFVAILHLIMTFAGTISYPGNTLYYALFSATYLGLILQATKSLNNPSFLFFGTMLWLGFFGKITTHLVLQYPFKEPTGFFSGNPAEWDELMLTATVGCLGCLIGKLSIDLTLKNKKNSFEIGNPQAPNFFNKYHKYFYALFILIVTATALLNTTLGIYMIGIVPVTILPWPLNGTISWLLYMGFILLLAETSNWEYSLIKKSRWTFGLTIFEGMIVGISTISRGTYVYHTLPYLLTTIFNKTKLSLRLKDISLRIAIFLVAFIVSLSCVTIFRSTLYADIPLDVKNGHSSSNGYSFSGAMKTIFQNEDSDFISKNISLVFTQVSGLLVDRWVGAEGVMAVLSYPQKSIELLTDSLARKPILGQQDIYEKISNSFYKPSSRYTFANIPGPIAFLYYSGNLWFVFFGMLALIYGLYILDSTLTYAFNNCFLSAQIGFYAANCFAQFGSGPRQLVAPVVITSTALVTLWLYKRYWTTRLVQQNLQIQKAVPEAKT